MPGLFISISIEYYREVWKEILYNYFKDEIKERFFHLKTKSGNFRQYIIVNENFNVSSYTIIYYPMNFMIF